MSHSRQEANGVTSAREWTKRSLSLFYAVLAENARELRMAGHVPGVGGTVGRGSHETPLQLRR